MSVLASIHDRQQGNAPDLTRALAGAGAAAMASWVLNQADPGPLDHVWLADQLSHRQAAVCASGYAPLDAQLPGGGWPVGALTEVLQEQSGLYAWRLLLPGLVEQQSTQKGDSPVVVVGAPFVPFGPALAAQGLAPERLLHITPVLPYQRLWAAEQALRCASVAAVVAWLPQARSEQLRRLHWAASTYQKLLFVFRPLACQGQASPAPLRVVLGASPAASTDDPAFSVYLLKRRGPPMAQALSLPAAHPRLQHILAASRWRQTQRSLANEPATAQSQDSSAVHAMALV